RRPPPDAGHLRRPQLPRPRLALRHGATRPDPPRRPAGSGNLHSLFDEPSLGLKRLTVSHHDLSSGKRVALSGTHSSTPIPSRWVPALRFAAAGMTSPFGAQSLAILRTPA